MRSVAVSSNRPRPTAMGDHAAPREGDDALTVLASIEPFHYPDIRFHACILQRADGLRHEGGPHGMTVTFLVGAAAIRLQRGSSGNRGAALPCDCVLCLAAARGAAPEVKCSRVAIS
jgi:hypothetical protein